MEELADLNRSPFTKQFAHYFQLAKNGGALAFNCKVYLLWCSQVRGAPAIAIVGCLSLATEIKNEEYVDKKSLRQDVEGKLNYLVSARPTAVNMKIAADELIQLANKLTKDDTVNVTEMKERYENWSLNQIELHLMLLIIMVIFTDFLKP